MDKFGNRRKRSLEAKCVNRRVNMSGVWRRCKDGLSEWRGLETSAIDFKHVRKRKIHVIYAIADLIIEPL